MKQNDKNKFETKIKLNQALENEYISKNNLEFVLKHIFKSNHYLIKHYKEMITKENINDMCTEINELLSYGDFFINDKVLILWVARKLDDILKEYEWILNGYLKIKEENLKERWNDTKYNNQRFYRTIIRCDDDCFKEYLPLRTSYNYNLSDDEIKCIKNFTFNMITEQQLEKQIREKLYDLKNNSMRDDEFNKVLSFIINYENILVFVNNESNFRWRIIDDNEWDLYDYLKENKIDYNIEDNFFIIDKDEKGNVIEIKSFNNIMSLIDLSEMVRYMRSHNISNLDEMYIDKNYKL